jgi:signal transduction histidine kinase
VKYSPAGGTITIRVEARGDQACVTVTDQGIGIPQASIPHLFQRFYRADNADSQHISGMGVGLYVVKEIVSLHGGDIEVTSTEGQGSTFMICLPQYEPVNETSPASVVSQRNGPDQNA